MLWKAVERYLFWVCGAEGEGPGGWLQGILSLAGACVRSTDGRLGVGLQYQVYLLDPTDPLFARIGQRFIEVQAEVYGTAHIYNVDT
jgi:hypothetical protein